MRAARGVVAAAYMLRDYVYIEMPPANDVYAYTMPRR